MSLSNLQILEKNIEILLLILTDDKKLDMILSQNMWDFYITNILNYTELYSRDHISSQTLIRSIESLGKIFRFISNNRELSSKKGATLLAIFNLSLELLLKDPIHIASEMSQIIAQLYHFIDVCKELLEVHKIEKVVMNIANNFIEKRTGKFR